GPVVAFTTRKRDEMEHRGSPPSPIAVAAFVIAAGFLLGPNEALAQYDYTCPTDLLCFPETSCSALSGQEGLPGCECGGGWTQQPPTFTGIIAGPEAVEVLGGRATCPGLAAPCIAGESKTATVRVLASRRSSVTSATGTAPAHRRPARASRSA